MPASPAAQTLLTNGLAKVRRAAEITVSRQKLSAESRLEIPEHGESLQKYAQVSRDRDLFVRVTLALEEPGSHNRLEPDDPTLLWDIGDAAYEQNDWLKASFLWRGARQFCGADYEHPESLAQFLTAPTSSPRRQASRLLHFNEVVEDELGSLMSSEWSMIRLDELLALDPSHVPALLIRAAVAAQGGEWADADRNLSCAFSVGGPYNLLRHIGDESDETDTRHGSRLEDWRSAAAWWPQQPLIQLTWAIVQFDSRNGSFPALERMEQVSLQEPESSIPLEVLARSLTDVGRLDEAEQAWRKALLLPVQSSKVKMYLGCALFRRGADVEGERHLTWYFDLFEHASWAHHEVGMQLAAADGIALARGLEALRVSMADETAPLARRIEATANAGNALRRLGRPAEGLPLCKHAVELASGEPPSAGLYAAKARAHWEAGEPEAALASFAIAADLPEASPSLVVEYIQRLLDSDKLESASQQANKLVLRGPEQGPEVANIASRLLSMKCPQAANELLSRFVQVGGEPIEIVCLLAAAAVAFEDNEKALAYYRQALRAEPDRTADIASDVARYFLRYEQEDLAAMIVAEGLEANPEHAELHQRQAMLSLYRDDLPGAQNSLRYALQVDTESLDSWNLLLTTLDSEDPDQAVERLTCLRQCCRLDPQNSSKLLTLTMELYNSDQSEEAERAGLRAVRMLPNDAYARHLYANCLCKVDKIHEACEQMQSALELEPDNDSLFATYGCMLMVAGRNIEAKEWLERALAADPENDWARANLSLVTQSRASQSER